MFNIDQTFSFGQANNARMQSSNLMEAEALKEPCPTCGAIPGKRCELSVGGPRKQSHLDRRLIAVDKMILNGKKP